ncbi:hypothetical protein CENSYa_1124 [Cenarchaeum symbiosum A]|uniref:Uncharacterized protein n=1 Tax=Cenarchaeum symbiosum (strain A) TaxID=414004 RepID=A0RWN6_CENSY|nr:hypothetical protein CENSYa_1124 [Cenarchaeum symbiosum A]
MGIFIAIFSNNPVFAPIIGIQTAGFFFIAYLSLAHSRFKRDKSSPPRRLTGEERTAGRVYRLAAGGIVAAIFLGVILAFNGYNEDIYPLDLARGHLTEVMRSTDPSEIPALVQSVKGHLPDEGNPVWIFQTSDTDWRIMQNQLDNMAGIALAVAGTAEDSAAYQTGMTNIKGSAQEIRQSIMDATPYAYVSPANILFSTVWIAVLIGVFAVLKQRKDKLQEYDLAQDV